MADTPDQKLIKKYDAKFKACASARKPFEEEWFTNLAFYFSKHYVQWVKSTTGVGNRLVEPKAPAWRVRLVANRIKPMIRKEMAKINKENPQFWVAPDTPEDEDIAAARCAEAIAEMLLTEGHYNFHSVKRQVIFWTAVTGNGFYRINYDQDRDDVVFSNVSPFHLWVPNLDEVEVENQPYLFHASAFTPDEIESMWGETLEADSKSEPSQLKYLHSLGLSAKEKELEQVHVKETWVKPCRDFPDGAMFIFAQDKLLYMHEALPEVEIDPVTGQELSDENDEPIYKEVAPSNVIGGGQPKSSYPYAHGQYPFAKVDHIPTGKFYAESPICDLVPLQKEYNRSRSQVIEARNLTSKPQYKVPRGSVDVRKLKAVPGLVIEYTPGFDPPEVMKNPELPQYIFTDQAQSLNDMEAIVNQNDITPPNVEAATAISFLQEENDSILENTIASLEEAVQKVGFQALTLIRDFWPDDKIVKVMSGNQLYETMQFKRSMLSPNIDFRVEPGSMAPMSRAARQALVMEMVDKGYIPPMEGLKHMQLSTTKSLYRELQVDSRQVERENFKMKNGMPIPLNDFDNDEVHAIQHARFMKSQTFEGLPDEIKANFIYHYKMHLVRLGEVEEVGPERDPNSGNNAESGTGEPAI